MVLWNLCYCKYLLLSASHRSCWVDIHKYRSQLRNAVQVKHDKRGEPRRVLFSQVYMGVSDMDIIVIIVAIIL